jgi:peptidyl-prolyl cis-trans isomerase C
MSYPFLSYPYYNSKENLDSPMQTIALHHILLKSSLLAQDIAQELELGADFAELARDHSACPSSHQGGFAGYHQQDDLPPAVITALATHDDQKSFAGPIETPLGFHLLKPVGEKPKLALSDQALYEQEIDQHEQISALEEEVDSLSS